MTLKLYYTDSNQLEFTANIVSCVRNGEYYEILLDQTGFFPGGGGQPHDLGWLNNIPVTRLKSKDGEIYHITREEVRENQVFGKVDSDRRYDYMQQHTGQHILSQALLKTGNYQTLSIHFGENYTAVEVHLSDISADQLIKVEALANNIINQNLPIKTKWISREELEKYSIRKPATVVEKIRIVEIENFDSSTCGGLHLQRTGEVGLIKITGQEKIRGNTRLIAKIGKRALLDYDAKINLVKTLQNILTCGEKDILKRIKDLEEQNKDNQKKLSNLQQHLVLFEADKELSFAPLLGQYKFIQKIYNNVDNNLVRLFANETSSRHGVITVAFNINNDAVFWLVNQSTDVKIDLPKIVEPILPLIEGKGGGNLQLMQGGGKRKEGISEFIFQLKRKIEQELP